MTLSKFEVGSAIAVLTAVVTVTVFLTKIGTSLSSAVSRIESLERGTRLEEEKKAAITEIEKKIESELVAPVPTGGIIAYYGPPSDKPPQGYLVCDGSPITLADYPDLYRILVASNANLKISDKVARLPDLRGEFLRGLDMNRGIDKERVLGSSQSDSLQTHTHVDKGHGHGIPTTGEDSLHGADAFPHGPKHHEDRPTTLGYATLGEPTQIEGGPPVSIGNETRPRNVAVNYLIKW